MAEEKISSRMVRGGLWLGAGRIIVNAIGFVSTLVLARLLVPEDFGLVALSSTLMVIIDSVTQMPVGSAIIQRQEDSREFYDAAWTIGVLRGLAIFLIVCAMAWPFSMIMGDSRLVLLVIVSASTALIEGLVNPAMARFALQLRYSQTFVLMVANKLAGFLVSISIAFSYKSYWALVFGGVASSLVYVIISYIYIPYRPSISFKRTRDILSFSLWLSYTNIVGTLATRLDPFLISGILGNGVLGLYKVGDELGSMPTREMVAPLNSTLFPAFSKLLGDQVKLAHSYRRVQALVAMLALPAGIGFATVANLAVPLLLGDKWLAATPIVQVVAAVFALQMLTPQAEAVFMAQGKPRIMFERAWKLMLVRYPLVITGLLVAGIPGLLVARCVMTPLIIGVNSYLLNRETGYGLFTTFTNTWRSLASTAVMVIVVLGAKPYLVAPPGASTWDQVATLLAIILLGAVVYFVCHIILWRIKGDEFSPEAFLLGVLKRRRSA